MIDVTEKAADEVRRILTEQKLPDTTALRVGVKGGGCSGLTYVLDIVDTVREDDKVISQHGVTLAVDKKSYIFLAGTELDYSGGLNGKGFIFNNPNAKKACGCGTSFSV